MPSRFNGKIINNRILIDVIISKNTDVYQGEKFIALIDTGATRTIIKPSIATMLNVLYEGKLKIKTATAHINVGRLYETFLFIPVNENVNFNNKNASSQFTRYDLSTPAVLDEQHGFDVLIGMDIISQSLLIINGNQYTICT